MESAAVLQIVGSAVAVDKVETVIISFSEHEKRKHVKSVFKEKMCNKFCIFDARLHQSRYFILSGSECLNRGLREYYYYWSHWSVSLTFNWLLHQRCWKTAQ